MLGTTEMARERPECFTQAWTHSGTSGLEHWILSGTGHLVGAGSEGTALTSTLLLQKKPIQASLGPMAVSCQWVFRGLGKLKCPSLRQTPSFPSLRFSASFYPQGLDEPGV